MDLYEAINTRRSVRKWQDRPIENDKLNRILEAGRVAPSASNRQPWKFIVVRDQQTRERLAVAAEQRFVARAPVVIAVVGVSPARMMSCGIAGDAVDCAIAIEHMAHAATAEGLGSCWIGHFNQEQAREILGVPNTMSIVELLPMGYPADEPRPRDRKSMSDVVCWEKFS